MDPAERDGLANAGWALVRAGNARGAERQFKAALAIDPQHVGALSGLAQAQLNLAALDAAGETADSLLRIAPNRAVGHRLRAEALRRRRKPGAADAARQAIALEPREALGYHILALCHADRKDAKAALKVCDDGLAAAPGSAVLMAQRADALLELRGGRAAQGQAMEALRLAPDYAYVQRVAAKIALARNQLERARALLGAVLRRNANDEAAVSLFLLAEPGRHRLMRWSFIVRYWRREHGALGHAAYVGGLVALFLAAIGVAMATRIPGVVLVVAVRALMHVQYAGHRRAVKAHFKTYALDRAY